MKKLFLSVILLLTLSSVATASIYYGPGNKYYSRPYSHCTITWYGKLYCSSNIND